MITRATAPVLHRHLIVLMLALMAIAHSGMAQSAPTALPPQAKAVPPAPPAKAPPPRTPFPIVAVPELANLGFIQPRSTVKTEFVLHNTLDKPVRVIKAEPSCTCTTLDLVGKTIPARGSITVPVEMKVSAATGLKSAGVGIVFEGIAGAVAISMQGEVSYPIRGTSVDSAGNIVPFIDAHSDPSRTKGTIMVASIDKKPFLVKSVQGAQPVYVGFEPGSEAPRVKYELAYDFSAVPCESMPPYLIIETDRSDSRLIDMRVRHECTRITTKAHFGEYRANAGIVAPGGSADFDVLMKKMGSARVTAVTSLDPRVTAALVGQTADGDGTLAHVRVTCRPDAKGLVFFHIDFTVLANGQEVKDKFLVYLVAE